MPRPNIPPQVLAARGVPIRLVDETEVRVCYTFHSLVILEEKYDGLAGALSALADPDSAQFGTIAGLLSAGLEHEQYDLQVPADPQVGGGNTTQRIYLDNMDVLPYLLDSARLGEYAKAMGDAFRQAFPQQVKAVEEAAAADPQPPVQEKDSPGPTGSTSEPSTSDGPPTSSGA